MSINSQEMNASLVRIESCAVAKRTFTWARPNDFIADELEFFAGGKHLFEEIEGSRDMQIWVNNQKVRVDFDFFVSNFDIQRDFLPTKSAW